MSIQIVKKRAIEGLEGFASSIAKSQIFDYFFLFYYPYEDKAKGHQQCSVQNAIMKILQIPVFAFNVQHP
jgi:hypothetical protein